MKKILSLLSLLTISGTAMPTTIAASPYQKEEQNLDILYRIKRSNQKNSDYEIKTIYNFTKDEYFRQKGDILFGTTNGVYLRKYGETTNTKIEGIDGEVKMIQPHNDGYNSVDVITMDGIFYYLNGNGYVYNHNFPYKVTTIYSFTKNEYYRKVCDRYIGTTNGVYLRKYGETTNTKIEGIDGEVKMIQPFNDDYNSVHIITKTPKNKNIIYYVNGNLYVHKQSDSDSYINNFKVKPNLISDLKTCINPVNDNSDATILAAVKAKNPNLDISQVYVKQKVINGRLEIGVNSNSSKYNTDSSVYCDNFKVKPNLISDLKTCINPVNDNSDATILAAVKAKNPNLDISQVYVKQKVINGRLEIGVNSNSSKYNTDSSVYCDNFKVRSNLNKVITNYELNLINASNNEISDKAILNELNYRNSNLDISQLEVINKTNTSATIKSKDNSDKYFGEKKIYFTVDNELNKNIVLYDLIKKAIFFKLRDDNLNLEFSKIKDIDLSYLQYSNIELKETITPQINIEDVYQNSCTGQSGLINNGSLIQTFKTPECRKTIENEIRIQLSNGLIKSKSLEQGQTTGREQSNSSSSGISKTNTKSLEIVDAFENIDVKQSSESSGWHAELSVNANASFNVGFASGGVSTTYSGGYNKNSETSQSHSYGHTNSQSTGSSESSQKEETKTKIISQSIGASKFSSSSNNVSLENTDVKSTTISEQVTWPSQEIKVNSNSKATIIIFIKKVTNQITLDLKQDISGNVIVKIKNKNGEEETIDFSIGELMQKLIQQKLLPSQISLSEFDENDIYFEGQINFLIKKGFKQDIIINEIKLN